MAKAKKAAVKQKKSKRASYEVSTLDWIDKEAMRSGELSGKRFNHVGFASDVVDTGRRLNDVYLHNPSFRIYMRPDMIVNSTFNVEFKREQPKGHESQYYYEELEIVRNLGSVHRSDGYIFNGFLQKNGKVLIMAGCQTHKSTTDYRKHVKGYNAAKAKKKAKETLVILKFFDNLAKALPKPATNVPFA